MAIGSRLRSLRTDLGLTQAQVASEVAVTHQHISRIEDDLAAPSLDLLARLSSVLGASTDYILTGERGPTADVVGAIRGDEMLSQAAKKHLLGLIDELRRTTS